MTRYFVVANSFAAPFVSDTSTGFVRGHDPEAAMERFVAEYSHPAGLYSALLYRDANAYHSGDPPICRWICNHELAMRDAQKDLDGCLVRSNGPGSFEINGRAYSVENPTDGKIIKEEKR